MKLFADYDMLNVHIGCVQSPIMLSMSVSHAAAPSAQLDFVLKYLESHAQTVRCLAAETVAQRAYVHSHGVKRQPGKGKDILKNVFPHYLWFGSCVYPIWCEIVSLVEIGDLLAPHCALDWSTRVGQP